MVTKSATVAIDPNLQHCLKRNTCTVLMTFQMCRMSVTLIAFVALLDGRVVDWLDDEKQEARYR
jgi:hypothetical protein